MARRMKEGDGAFSFGHVAFQMAVEHPRRGVE